MYCCDWCYVGDHTGRVVGFGVFFKIIVVGGEVYRVGAGVDDGILLVGVNMAVVDDPNL